MRHPIVAIITQCRAFAGGAARLSARPGLWLALLFSATVTAGEPLPDSGPVPVSYVVVMLAAGAAAVFIWIVMLRRQVVVRTRKLQQAHASLTEQRTMLVTERQQAEEALRQREMVMSAIVNQAGDGIELSSLETFRFLEFNDAACQMLGYTREEYARLTIFDIQADLSEDDIRAMAASTPVGHSLQFEGRLRRKDGRIIDVAVKVTKIELEGRQYTVAIWRDISESKRAERELEQHRNHLQALVEEQTRELATGDRTAAPQRHHRRRRARDPL